MRELAKAATRPYEKAAFERLAGLLEGGTKIEDYDQAQLDNDLEALGLFAVDENSSVGRQPEGLENDTAARGYYEFTHRQLGRMAGQLKDQVKSRAELASEEQTRLNLARIPEWREDLQRWQERMKTGSQAEKESEEKSEQDKKENEESREKQGRETQKEETRLEVVTVNGEPAPRDRDGRLIVAEDLRLRALGPEGRLVAVGTHNEREARNLNEARIEAQRQIDGGLPTIFRGNNRVTRVLASMGNGAWGLGASLNPWSETGHRYRTRMLTRMGLTGAIDVMAEQLNRAQLESGDAGAAIGSVDRVLGRYDVTTDSGEASIERGQTVFEKIFTAAAERVIEEVEMGGDIEGSAIGTAELLLSIARNEINQADFTRELSARLNEARANGLITAEQFADITNNPDLYASNLWEVGQRLRRSISEAVESGEWGDLSPEQKEQYEIAIQGLGDERIHLAQAKRAIDDNRPGLWGRTEGVLDRMFDYTHQRPILGMIISPVFASASANILSAGGVRLAAVAAGGVATGVGIAATAPLGLVPLMAGVGVAAGAAFFRRRGELAIKRGTEAQARARGIRYEGGESTRVAEYNFADIAEVGTELADRILAGDTDAAIQGRALLRAELRLTDETNRGVDLIISPEGEVTRSNFGQRGEVVRALREFERTGGTVDMDAVEERTEALVETVYERDNSFDRFRFVQGGRSAVIAGAVALGVGFLAREGADALAEAIDGTGQNDTITILESLAGQRPREYRASFYEMADGTRPEVGTTRVMDYTMPKSGEKIQVAFELVKDKSGNNAHWVPRLEDADELTDYTFDSVTGKIQHAYGLAPKPGKETLLENWHEVQDFVADRLGLERGRVRYVGFADQGTPRTGDSWTNVYDSNSNSVELNLASFGKGESPVLDASAMIGMTARNSQGGFDPFEINPSTDEYAFLISGRERGSAQFDGLFVPGGKGLKTGIEELIRDTYFEKNSSGAWVPKEGVMVNVVKRGSSNPNEIIALAETHRNGDSPFPELRFEEDLTVSLENPDFVPPVDATNWAEYYGVGTDFYPPFGRPMDSDPEEDDPSPVPIPYYLASGFSEMEEETAKQYQEASESRGNPNYDENFRPEFDDAWDYFEESPSPGHAEIIESLKDEVAKEPEKQYRAFICIPVGLDDVEKIENALLAYLGQKDSDGKDITGEIKIVLTVNGPAGERFEERTEEAQRIVDNFTKNHPELSVTLLSKEISQEEFTRNGMAKVRGVGTDFALMMAAKIEEEGYDPVILSQDADVIGVNDKLINGFERSFAEDESIDALQGRLVWNPRALKASPLLGYMGARLMELSYFYRANPYELDPATGEIVTDEKGRPIRNKVATATTSGANTAIRASALCALGGYFLDRPGDRGSGGEDSDLAKMLEAKGRGFARANRDTYVVTHGRRIMDYAKIGVPPWRNWDSGNFSQSYEIDESIDGTFKEIADPNFDYDTEEGAAVVREAIVKMLEPSRDSVQWYGAGFVHFVMQSFFGLERGDYSLEYDQDSNRAHNIKIDEDALRKKIIPKIKTLSKASEFLTKGMLGGENYERERIVATEGASLEYSFLNKLEKRAVEGVHLIAIQADMASTSAERVKILKPLEKDIMGKSGLVLEDLSERGLEIVSSKLLTAIHKRLDELRILSAKAA
jgi:hypothetical protein